MDKKDTDNIDSLIKLNGGDIEKTLHDKDLLNLEKEVNSIDVIKLTNDLKPLIEKLNSKHSELTSQDIQSLSKEAISIAENINKVQLYNFLFKGESDNLLEGVISDIPKN